MALELDDAEIVRRIEAGDRDSEGELYRRMASRIRLYGLRHLRDEDAAQDLTQQVLVTVIEALRAGKLREPEKLPSFVLGTCRMTVLNLKRGQQRKDRLWAQFGPRSSSYAPEPVLDLDQLEKCVQSLRERERTVVVLTYFDEESGKDVAGLLGVSEANVRVIRHRALHSLRECLGISS